MPNAFIGLNLMGNGKVAKIKEELQSVFSRHPGLPMHAVIEWMCHPGYITHEMDDFSASAEREAELSVILSPDLLDLLDECALSVGTLEDLLSS